MLAKNSNSDFESKLSQSTSRKKKRQAIHMLAHMLAHTLPFASTVLRGVEVEQVCIAGKEEVCQ